MGRGFSSASSLPLAARHPSRKVKEAGDVVEETDYAVPPQPLQVSAAATFGGVAVENKVKIVAIFLCTICTNFLPRSSN